MLEIFNVLHACIYEQKNCPLRPKNDVQKVFLHVEDILQLRQEPLIDIGHLPDFIDRVTSMEGGGYRKYAFVSRVYKLLIDILN